MSICCQIFADCIRNMSKSLSNFLQTETIKTFGIRCNSVCKIIVTSQWQRIVHFGYCRRFFWSLACASRPVCCQSYACERVRYFSFLTFIRRRIKGAKCCRLLPEPTECKQKFFRSYLENLYINGLYINFRDSTNCVSGIPHKNSS